MAALSAMTSDEITELIRRWNDGDRRSGDEVIAAMLPQLRTLAHRIASDRSSNTLDTTALANELYLRFAHDCPGASNRQHLLALASLTMQHLLVDHARSHLRIRRGGGAPHVQLSDVTGLTESRLEQVVMIDDALRRLAEHNARQAEVFRMRFFGGFSVRDVAGSFEVSENTIIRDWSAACAFLREAISSH
jgi:RNA polymerase sigma factor (TIGR02999 family)